MHRLAFLCAAALLAATAAAAGPPSPLDAGAPAAPVAYDSAFAGYQKYEEGAVADWKQTNAAIAGSPAHGGHAGHGMAATEAAPADPHAGHDMASMQPATPATAAKAKPKATVKPKPAPKADPHAGHHQH